MTQRIESSTDSAVAEVNAVPDSLASETADPRARLERAEAGDVAHREARAAALRRKFEGAARFYVGVHCSLCIGAVALVISLERVFPNRGTWISAWTGIAPADLRYLMFRVSMPSLIVMCVGLFVMNVLRLARMRRELIDITGDADLQING